jgi:hypothetical protein
MRPILTQDPLGESVFTVAMWDRVLAAAGR